MTDQSAIDFGKELIRRVHAARWDQDMPDAAAAEIYGTIRDRLARSVVGFKDDSPEMLEALIRYAARQFDIQEGRVRHGLA